MNIWEMFFIQPLVNGLLVFYHLLFADLGLAIIALTVFIRLILVPVTLPSLRAMQVMKDLGPEINRIKKKHAGDKAKIRQAQADLYKSKGVNPAAGCLPQIVQLVVLFALFGVFNLIAQGNATENINKFAYGMLRLVEPIRTSFLYLDLAKPDVFPVAGIPFALPGPVLLLSALLQFLSSKMMMPQVTLQEKQAAKTESEVDDIGVAMQKQMLYMFPVFTLIIGIKFASGLVLYWAVMSLFQMVQQYFVSGFGSLSPLLDKIVKKK